MKYLWWRIRVAFWFWSVSGMPMKDAWDYSGNMREFFTDEFGPCDPREAVDVEISYWEH